MARERIKEEPTGALWNEPGASVEPATVDRGPQGQGPPLLLRLAPPDDPAPRESRAAGGAPRSRGNTAKNKGRRNDARAVEDPVHIPDDLGQRLGRLSFDAIVQKVALEHHETLFKLVALIDDFCAKHLNEEYRELCRVMAAAMCAEDCEVTRGKLEGWACGIVYAVGWVNFLTATDNSPHMRAEDICKAFGVSPATMHNRFQDLKFAFDFMPMDPLWCLPSRLPDHPLIYMMELDNGMIIDARVLPRKLQVQAYECGRIPLLPPEDCLEE